MDEFSTLRKLAKEKRDREFAIARADYESSLLRIAAIERSLLPKARRRRDSIGACVDPLVPQDRPFTIPQLMAGLEAINGRNAWVKNSVTAYIGRLRKRGIIRRVRRAGGNRPAVFAMEGIHLAQQPFDGMTLAEVIRAALTRPMNGTELAVAILEAGYQTSQRRIDLRHSVLAALRKGAFRKVGGKWVVG